MGKDTWLKLHTSILLSAKFVNLPSNDHRWAFICLLILAKKRLESIPECQLLGHLNLSKRRWKMVEKDLVVVGLLDDTGKVNGFEDSQLTPDAYRMRKMRERNKDRNKDRNKLRNSSLDSRVQSVDSKNPLTPYGGTDRYGRKHPEIIHLAASRVILAVNDKFGLNRRPTKTLLAAVALLVRSGHDPNDIVMVAKHRLRAEEWFLPRKYGAEALIRLKAFDSALERAKEDGVNDGIYSY